VVLRLFSLAVAALSLSCSALVLGGDGPSGSCPVGGTFDNTGGPPPAGDPLAYEIIEPGFLYCYDLAPEIVRTADDMSDELRRCAEESEGRVDEILASLEGDDYALFMNVVFPSVTDGYEFAAVHQDGDTVRPWILVQNPRLGVVCARPPTLGMDYDPTVVLLSGELPARVETVQVEVNPRLEREPDSPITLGDGTICGSPTCSGASDAMLVGR
jgi:hypothetical protein